MVFDSSVLSIRVARLAKNTGRHSYCIREKVVHAGFLFHYWSHEAHGTRLTGEPKRCLPFKDTALVIIRTAVLKFAVEHSSAVFGAFRPLWGAIFLLKGRIQHRWNYIPLGEHQRRSVKEVFGYCVAFRHVIILNRFNLRLKMPSCRLLLLARTCSRFFRSFAVVVAVLGRLIDGIYVESTRGQKDFFRVVAANDAVFGLQETAPIRQWWHNVLYRFELFLVDVRQPQLKFWCNEASLTFRSVTVRVHWSNIEHGLGIIVAILLGVCSLGRAEELILSDTVLTKIVSCASLFNKTLDCVHALRWGLSCYRLILLR